MSNGILGASRALLLNPLTAAPVWHVVDAKGHVVGKLAQKIAKIVMGKHKPVWDPAVDCGDYVVVINAKDVQFTGKKFEQKYYKWHTGYPGGLKTMQAKKMIEKKPTEVLRRAVMGMIPKNKLKYKREEKLKIYAEDQHPHIGQVSASAVSPLQQDIPVYEEYRKDLKITDEEMHLVGGKKMTYHKTTEQGDMKIVTEKITGFLERAAEHRAMQRLNEIEDLRLYEKKPPQPLNIVSLPHKMEIGTDPARLRYPSEKKFEQIDTGDVRWDWPLPGEKFEDNPDQLGRRLSDAEWEQVLKKEEQWNQEEEWRLIMRLVDTKTRQTARNMYAELPKDYQDAWARIPAKFVKDEREAETRMKEALGLLNEEELAEIAALKAKSKK
eukprot:TRINITY_DN7854_c0_g1_i1.p1 TRINITY_DN7854_c0_g1~~TRINITY_DN7854_c0_g1_i1.p1  ORF type:complete len:382 (+),score=137.34 TRINITY_DN7854_c0_g1_i1:63-1208(+)